MRSDYELRQAFHGGAKDVEAYDRATEAGNRAVYELGRADAENNDWRDVSKELPDTGKSVEVWGDGRGNVHLAWLSSNRWLGWESNKPLPFAPTHWRPLRPGPRKI